MRLRRNATSAVIPFTIEEVARHVMLHVETVEKKGHLGKVCMSEANASTTAAVFSPTICSITAACPNSLSQASVNVSVYGNTLSALIDSGSSDSFISQTVAEQLNLKIHPSKQDISMALTSLKTHVIGHYLAVIDLNQHVYTCTALVFSKTFVVTSSSAMTSRKNTRGSPLNLEEVNLS